MQAEPYLIAFWAVIAFVIMGVMAAANGKIKTATLFAILAFVAWQAYVGLAVTP